ncbi:MAG: hypothetical protein ACKVHE_01785 [Planctomycetales bacterium]
MNRSRYDLVMSNLRTSDPKRYAERLFWDDYSVSTVGLSTACAQSCSLIRTLAAETLGKFVETRTSSDGA